MITLTEDLAKAFLRNRSLPVPAGHAADTPEAAAEAARKLGGRVVVKALIAAGRRGKANAVRFADTPEAAQEAARDLLDLTIADLRVDRVYVEAREDIETELYLGFILDSYPPKILASREGGVDIEEIGRERPDAISRLDVDPLCGVKSWHAVQLWERAGVDGELLPALARLTAALWDAFCSADALTLELNPIAVRKDGSLCLVGAMLGVDDAALRRHPQWRGAAIAGATRAGRPANERELAVIAANNKTPGAVFRYSELDGDIGFVVGGGGASLLQHDLMLAMGAAPANHLDATPGPGWKDKMGAVFDAILANPKVRGILVSYNFLQLARVDLRMQHILDILIERHVDPTELPIVIRLFGPGEENARAIAATLPGLHYMEPDSPIDAAVARIIELTGGPRAAGAAR
jgi:succinyl-CoA synthetase beta subunit/citryl-CoA synthetase large subunit